MTDLNKIIDEFQYSILLNDNAYLILNALDYLSKKDNLIALRKSNLFSRKFIWWENLRKQNALVLAEKEREILDQIASIKVKLNDLWRKKNFEERQDFSGDELAVIAEFRNSLNNKIRELSNLQTDINQNIKQKQALAVFFNLYFIPLIIIGTALGFWIINRKKNRYCVTKKFSLSKSAIIFSVVCITLFSAGIFISMHSSDNDNELENQLIFPNWKQQINLIENIYLEKNGKKLHFYRKDGLWYIKGYENYPLYQRRIINLMADNLTAFIEGKPIKNLVDPETGYRKL